MCRTDTFRSKSRRLAGFLSLLLRGSPARTGYILGRLCFIRHDAGGMSERVSNNHSTRMSCRRLARNWRRHGLPVFAPLVLFAACKGEYVAPSLRTFAGGQTHTGGAGSSGRGSEGASNSVAQTSYGGRTSNAGGIAATELAGSGPRSDGKGGTFDGSGGSAGEIGLGGSPATGGTGTGICIMDQERADYCVLD